MEFLRIEDNKLIFSIDLKECRNCHKPMAGWHEAIPAYLETTFRANGISKEVYGDFGICRTCVDEKDFPRECTCCGKDRMFPSEFKYQLTEYAKYPDDETDFSYICKFCVKDKPEAVMNLLVDADDSEIVKGRK